MTVNAIFRVTGVNAKAGKDADGAEITVMEIKMVSDDLAAVAGMVHQRGKYVVVQIEAMQPHLPLFDVIQQAAPSRKTTVDQGGVVLETQLETAEFVPYEQRPTEELAAGNPDGDWYEEIQAEAKVAGPEAEQDLREKEERYRDAAQELRGDLDEILGEEQKCSHGVPASQSCAECVADVRAANEPAPAKRLKCAAPRCDNERVVNGSYCQTHNDAIADAFDPRLNGGRKPSREQVLADLDARDAALEAQR